MKADLAAIMLAGTVGAACVPVQDSAEKKVAGQTVFQSCGVDERVDYASLSRFGPWDDRNYKLTLGDLDFLSANEHELHDPIPAFFRIELRKEMPGLATSGPAQYPRSAVPMFGNRHGQLRNEIRNASDCLSKH